MTLYEYLKLHKDDEVTVSDVYYDTESYWYWYDEKHMDKFNRAVTEISKHLKIKKINNWNVICNISEVIEKHMKEIEKVNLFRNNDIDYIMYDFDSIIAGYVSEEWMEDFANAICR